MVSVRNPRRGEQDVAVMLDGEVDRVSEFTWLLVNAEFAAAFDRRPEALGVRWVIRRSRRHAGEKQKTMSVTTFDLVAVALFW